MIHKFRNYGSVIHGSIPMLEEGCTPSKAVPARSATGWGLSQPWYPVIAAEVHQSASPFTPPAVRPHTHLSVIVTDSERWKVTYADESGVGVRKHMSTVTRYQLGGVNGRAVQVTNP